MKELREEVYQDFHARVQKEFIKMQEDIFEKEMMPFCEKVVSESMQNLLQKLDRVAKTQKSETNRSRVEAEKAEKDNSQVLQALQELSNKIVQSHEMPKPPEIARELSMGDTQPAFQLKIDKMNSTDVNIKNPFSQESDLLSELDPPVRSSSINSSMIISTTSLLDGTGLQEEQKEATLTPSFNSPVIQVVPKDKIHLAAKHLWPISQSNNIEMINQAFSNQRLMFFIAKLI